MASASISLRSIAAAGLGLLLVAPAPALAVDLITDGDMSAPDTAAWTHTNLVGASTASKATPPSGTQSLKVVSAAGRRADFDWAAAQTVGTIDGGADVFLSFWWGSQFFLSSSAGSASLVVEVSPTGSGTWTAVAPDVSVSVSSADTLFHSGTVGPVNIGGSISSTGSWDIRLRVVGKTGNDNGAYVEIWWDDVVLDVRTPNSPPTVTLDAVPSPLTASSQTLTGTAGDSDGTVTAVEVQLERGGTTCWDGAGWGDCLVWLPATATSADFATWSYAWTGFSLESDVTIRTRATDDAGGTTEATQLVTVDNLAPRVATAVRFDAAPVSGAGFILRADWTESSPGTPTFQYVLNGAGWSTPADSDAGASNAAAKSYAGPLDGNDVFDGIRASHTDAQGNGPTVTEDTTTVYVRPATPPAPTVGGATGSTLAVTVEESEPGLGLLYAIRCDSTGQYVQADGSLGAAAVWRTRVAWGVPLTVTGLDPSTPYDFSVAAGNPNDATPSDVENSASVFGPPGSGATTVGGDFDAPCAATGLQVVSRTESSLTFEFTAPVEDCAGGSGDPLTYRIRFADTPIDDVVWTTAEVFNDAWPASVAPGGLETVTLSGLEANQSYWLQVKAEDDAGNVGPLAVPAAAGTDGGRTPLRLGWNHAGVEGTLSVTNKCVDVFGAYTGSNSCLYWTSTGTGDWAGSYTDTGRNGAIESGRGYWLETTVAGVEIPPPADATPTAGPVSVALQPGMNMVANPHDRPVRVADLTITRNGTDTRTWAAAVSAGWVLPAVYAYDGLNYLAEIHDAMPAGRLHPRKGYFLKLRVDDGVTYDLSIPDPTP